jgi:hypothetical protein
VGYLTTGQEAIVNNAFGQLHYEFAERNIFYAVKEGTTTIVTESPNHNAFYGAAPVNTTTTITKESGMFFARLRYPKDGENFYRLNIANNNEDLGAKIAENYFRIITDITGHNLLKDAKDVYLGDEVYSVASTPEKHGLFQKNFYTYYLEEVK